MKILVVRNDKLGDFLVSLPAYACIKKNLPSSTVTALVPAYTRDLAALCSQIDKIVIDPGRENGIQAAVQLAKTLKAKKFDAVVTLFSTSHTGLAVWLARIPYRLAPATKIAQLAYNHRLKQRRSQSIKPEHEYNLDLALKFLTDMGVKEIERPEPPFLSMSAETRRNARTRFLAEYQIPESSRLIFVHAGSGGSSNNLSLDQYAELIRLLNIAEPYHIILSSGPGEIEHVKRLSEMLRGIPHTIYESNEGLGQFVEYINLAELFIGGSTGPLHIAGALDVPTAAFYVRLRTSSALRWQTVNSPGRRLAFSPEEEFGEEDMSGVDLVAAAKKIKETFLR
jgi:ADP-heptose:LPS heptosyltransferase